MAIIGIVARARNGAIGRNDTLPWRYPADLKFFRQQTTGHACVMGRRTWLSLGKPLPNRLNIVLSRSLESVPAGVANLRSVAQVLAWQPYLACDLYVIGGAQIYQDFVPYITRWYVTEIPLDVPDADTFMPDNFLDGFTLRATQELDAGLLVKCYEK
jgi:dihydrofolate reductase